MSGSDLRNKMTERAETYASRPLQPYEMTFLNFMSTYVTDEAHQKLLFSFLTDYVFRIFFMSASARFPNDNSLKSEDIKKFLREKTSVPDDDIDRIQRLLKAALGFKYAPRVKNERKARIREKASGRCYLCGFVVNEEDESEIDHVWPHSLGGKNSKENLRVAHAACAAIKADAATLADVLTGGTTYAIKPGGITSPAYETELWPHAVTKKNEFNSYRRKILISNVRLAILMKQEYKCFECGQDFSDAGEAEILNSENSEEWSILSMNAYCETCSPKIISSQKASQ